MPALHTERWTQAKDSAECNNNNNNIEHHTLHTSRVQSAIIGQRQGWGMVAVESWVSLRLIEAIGAIITVTSSGPYWEHCLWSNRVIQIHPKYCNIILCEHSNSDTQGVLIGSCLATYIEKCTITKLQDVWQHIIRDFVSPKRSYNMTGNQSSTTWRAIDDRRLSLKAIDERVFTKFRDKKCRIYKFAQQKCRIYPFSRQICRIHTFLCQKSLVP